MVTYGRRALLVRHTLATEWLAVVNIDRAVSLHNPYLLLPQLDQKYEALTSIQEAVDLYYLLILAAEQLELCSDSSEMSLRLLEYTTICWMVS